LYLGQNLDFHFTDMWRLDPIGRIACDQSPFACDGKRLMQYAMNMADGPRRGRLATLVSAHKKGV